MANPRAASGGAASSSSAQSGPASAAATATGSFLAPDAGLGSVPGAASDPKSETVAPSSVGYSKVVAQAASEPAPAQTEARRSRLLSSNSTGSRSQHDDGI